MKLLLVLVSIFLFSSVSYQLEGKPDPKDDNNTPAPPPSAPPAPPAEPPSLLDVLELLKSYIIASKTTPEPPTTTTPEPTTTVPEIQPIFPENFTWIDLPDESGKINPKNGCIAYIDTFSVRGKCLAHHLPRWAPHTCYETWGLIKYNNTYFIRFDHSIVSYESVLKTVHRHPGPDFQNILDLYRSYVEAGDWGEQFSCDTAEGSNIAVLNGEELPFTTPLKEYEPHTEHTDILIQDHEMVEGLCHAVGKVGGTYICSKYQIDRFALRSGYWYVNRAAPLVDTYGYTRLSTVILEESDGEALRVIVEELGYIVNGRPEAEHNRYYPMQGTFHIDPEESGMEILGQGKHKAEFVFSGWFTWRGFLVVCVLLILLIILFFLFVILYCEWRKASSKTQSTIRTQTTTTTTTVTKDGYKRLPNYDLDDDDDALLDSAASGTGKGNSTPPPASAPASASTPSVSMV